MKIIIPFCLTLIIFVGSAGISERAEPIKVFCLSGTKYSHSPIAGKCSASYEKVIMKPLFGSSNLLPNREVPLPSSTWD
tara:strand:- start:1861 stop:2097 length:237 start_codon:yes stop_codon:yes gene_type:complete